MANTQSCENKYIKSGIFKSTKPKDVKDSNGNLIKKPINGDDGFFELTILDKHIFVRGVNPLKGWINSGYGFPLTLENNENETTYEKPNEEIRKDSLIKFYWSDSPLSLSCEKNYLHECIVQVTDQDSFKLIKILQGEAVAFGNWERINDIDYQYEESNKTTSFVDKTKK